MSLHHPVGPYEIVIKKRCTKAERTTRWKVTARYTVELPGGFELRCVRVRSFGPGSSYQVRHMSNELFNSVFKKETEKP